MNTSKKLSRLLGAAFLFVFFASLVSDSLLSSVAGSGSISDILVNISNNITLVQISNMVALFNCLGIVILAVLLYVVLNKQNKIIALVALGGGLSRQRFWLLTNWAHSL